MTVKLLLGRLIALMMGVSFLPIYFDLSDFSVAISNEPFQLELSIPIPIAIIAISLVLVILLITSSKFLKKPLDNSYGKMTILLTFLFFLHCIFISELPFTRALQASLFAMPLFVLLKIRNMELGKHIIYSIMLIFGLFNLIYFIGLTINANSFPIINKYEFVMFYNYEIYAALISYSSVLALFLTVVLFYFFNLSKDEHIKKLLVILLMCVLIFLVMSSARKSSVIQVIITTLVYFFFFIKSRGGRQLFFLTNIILFMIFAYYNSLAFIRFSQQSELGQLDGSRIEHWGLAIDFLMNSDSGWLFGAVEDQKFNSHNFLLDTLLKVGIVGFIFFTVIVAFLIKSINIFFRDIGSNKLQKITFNILFAQLFIDNIVNASVAQPYYFTCLIFSYVAVINFNKHTSEIVRI